MNVLTETILLQQDIIDELHRRVELYRLFTVLFALVIMFLLVHTHLTPRTPKPETRNPKPETRNSHLAPRNS